GLDTAKDQSYVLYMLGQPELDRTLLPVGELTKAQVRDHAARLGLRTAAKPESMDVCFITRGGREEFVTARAGARPGAVVDGSGVRFERAQPRVAPGQVVALYDGDTLVGGGIAV